MIVNEFNAIGVVICSVVCLDLILWFFFYTFGLCTLIEFFISEKWAPSVHMAILAIALAIGIIIIIY